MNLFLKQKTLLKKHVFIKFILILVLLYWFYCFEKHSNFRITFIFNLWFCKHFSSELKAFSKDNIFKVNFKFH